MRTKTKASKTKLSEAVKRKRGVADKIMTMREAAAHAGVGLNAIYRAEQGKAIGAEKFLRICAWLRLDPRQVEMR
jgi:DNA-binding Xre family transcriptional regulator